MTRALGLGIVLWVVGTVGLRFSGHGLLRSDHIPQTLLLFAVSFVLMVFLIPRICRQLGQDHLARFRAATLLMLPTLLLDSFSCVYFTRVFPNLDPGSAGAFGGWMLISCAGAVVGVWIRP